MGWRDKLKEFRPSKWSCAILIVLMVFLVCILKQVVANDEHIIKHEAVHYVTFGFGVLSMIYLFIHTNSHIMKNKISFITNEGNVKTLEL